MDEGERSLGEIARRLEEVFARLEQVASDLPRTFVSRELFNAREDLYRSEQARLQLLVTEREKQVNQQFTEYQRRIDSLEDDKTWLYRLVIGAVILALIGLALGVAGQAIQPSTSNKTRTSQVGAK